MALLPGTRLGTYEITAQIGVGGMGEVYRATDTNLGRAVALKVLPEAVAHDAGRLARFEREAKTLAALNHPHIAAIYGFEKSGGSPALVMELVEGPTLAEQIASRASPSAFAEATADRRSLGGGWSGPAGLPIDEALPIAMQIAEALEAAHEVGIVHRDLKPANIKIRPDGTVKVLDFGLAKALGPAEAGHYVHQETASLSMSPTITSPAMITGVGMILGTAAYMSPEQARGKPVDKRADIWAFGCVLYEMLAGRRAFEDEDVSMTLSQVLQREPDFDALPSSVPPRVRQALRVCLRKDPKQRAGDIRDVRLALEGAFETALPQPATLAPSRSRGTRLAWMVAAVALLAAAGLAIPAVRYLRETPPPPETRADVSTPPTSDPTSFALSPDGRQLVFGGAENGASRLWLRPLGATLAQPLPGTEGGAFPFWSPDSKSVAFFAEGKLKRIDLGGGRPVSIADAPNARGGTWNVEGVILFAPNTNGRLFRVPASGGTPAAVTTLGQRTSHRMPFFLPDGRQFLFGAGGGLDAPAIYLGSMDSAEAHSLVATDMARAAYVPSGWLLWVRGGTLMAQRLDLERKALTGDPVTLADPVAVDVNSAAGALSVSAGGLVAYRTGGTASQRQLTWFDRSGEALGALGAADDSGLVGPGLSPDGRRAVVFRTVQGNTDIWILDGTRASRFTFDPGSDVYPAWSPDGSRIVFDSNRKARRHLYQKAANGAGSEELLLESAEDKTANSWSPDGRFLLYRTQGPTTASDLWVLPVDDAARKPFPFLSRPFDERTGEFSPDGRWVAYQSLESGRWEIYVRPFPGPGGQWQVSTSGGIQPRWRRDGKELYYIAPNATLMAAAVTVNGDAFQPGVPVALFQTRIWGGGGNANNRQQYDVAPDGRFLINVTAGDERTPPITLLMNWTPPRR